MLLIPPPHSRQTEPQDTFMVLHYTIWKMDRNIFHTTNYIMIEISSQRSSKKLSAYMGNSKGPDLPDKPHVSVKGYDFSI